MLLFSKVGVTSDRYIPNLIILKVVKISSAIIISAMLGSLLTTVMLNISELPSL